MFPISSFRFPEKKELDLFYSNFLSRRFFGRYFLRLILFCLLGLLSVSYGQTAGGKVWNATTDTIASKGSNWVGGVAPVAGDTLVFDNTSSSNCYLDINPGPGGFRRLEMKAEYTGTVTILTEYTGAYDTLYIEQYCIVNGGILTHRGNFSNETYRLCLKVGGKLIVGNNGSIDVSTRGLALGARLGPGAPRQDIMGDKRYGAGHAGRGGRNDDIFAPGHSYGSIFLPLKLGSTGSRIPPSGAGGAAVIIVGDSAIINGEIKANGYQSSAGGASGGSIYLKAGTLYGSGIITANSDTSAESDPCLSAAAHGSGGRIAVILTKPGRTFDGFNGAIFARGSGNGCTPGAAGTVYRQAGDQADGHGTITIANCITGKTKTTDPRVLTPVGGVDTLEYSDVLTNADLLVKDSAVCSLYSSIQIDSLWIEPGTEFRLGGQTLSCRIFKLGETVRTTGAFDQTVGAEITTAGWICVGGATPPAAPSNLTYSANPATYTAGVTITNNTPSTNGGTPTSFSITPALPSGLNFNSTTGVISGTPAQATAQTTHTVTAANGSGSTQSALTITVILPQQAPSNLTYSANPAIYTVGVTITDNTPNTNGGTPTSYAINPELPEGLSFSSETGVISGTPGAASAQTTYTVTTANDVGSTDASLVITVVAAPEPPSNLTYSANPAIYTVGVTITDNTPNTNGGTPTSYAIDPELPEGLSFSSETGVISGTPGAASAQTTYTVTAANDAGSTDAALIITIIEPGTITNPLSVRGTYIDSSRVLLTLSGYDVLPLKSDDSVNYVDSLGLWYSSTGYPSLPAWTTAGKKYSLTQQLQAGATSFSDTVSVPPLDGPASYYYCMASPRWHTTQATSGDSLPPFGDSTTGARILMYDTMPVPITLSISGNWSVPDTLTISLSNTTEISPKADSVIIWYSLDYSTEYTQTTGTVEKVAAATVKSDEPYGYTIVDAGFNGEEKTVYFAVALKGVNGVLSDYVTDSATVGFTVPVNTILLRADSVFSYGVKLSWSRKDSVRIWYGTEEVPLGRSFDATPFLQLNPPRTDSTQNLLTLNPQTTYYFGLQRFADGLWSAVTDSSRISVATPAYEGDDTIPNQLVIDSLWYDPADGNIMLSFHLDTTGGLWSETMQAGIAYDLSDFPSQPSQANQIITMAGLDTIVSLALSQDIYADTTYYISLFLRDTGRTDWTQPTDHSRGMVRTPADETTDTLTDDTTCQRIVLFSPSDTSVTALNGLVTVTWESGIGGGMVVDTIRHWEPSSLPAGMQLAAQPFVFSVAEPIPPVTIGITFDISFEASDVRIYRDSAGILFVEYGSYISGNTAWLTTGDLSKPFLVCRDAVAPEVSLISPTDVSEAVAPGEDIAMSFAISDNIANARWTLLCGAGNAAFGHEENGTLGSTVDSISATIPGLFVSDRYGLRIYLVVTDGIHTDTINLSRQVQCDTSDTFSIPALKLVPLRATSFLDNTDAASCLRNLVPAGDWKYDIRNFRIYTWYPYVGNSNSADKWVQYSDAMANAFLFDSARVVWVYCRTETDISFGGGITTSLEKPYEIRLKPKQWTDFALPFKFAVLLKDVLAATTNGDSLSIARWNRETGNFEYIFTQGIASLSVPDDTLLYEPLNDAYSAYNPLTSTITLRIPPIPLPMSTELSRRRKTATRTPGWDVQVRARSMDGGFMNLVRCGVSPSSGSIRLYPMRQALESAGIGVVGEINGPVFAHATVRNTTDGGNTFILAFFNQTKTPQRFQYSLEGIDALPENAVAAVVGPGGGESGGVPDIITVSPSGTAYRYLAVGSQAYVDGIISMARLAKPALVGVRPNPFSQRALIEYTLPFDGVRGVDFDFFDATGRKVWHVRLTKGFRPGLNTFVWNSNDRKNRPMAAGMYEVIMRVYADNCPTTSFTKRLLYVK